MPIVELDVGGQPRRVEVDDGFTPADLDYIASQLEGDTGSSTTTTPTSAKLVAQRQSEQRFGRGIAETVGGVLGGTAGAMSGGGTPFSGVNAVLGAGLGQTAGGQAFDALAQLFGTQQPKSLKDTAKDVGADFLSGAKAEMGGQIVGTVAGKAIDKTLGTIATRRARRLAMESRKAAFKQQGIEPMASDLTQSRAVGMIENAPKQFIAGSGRLQRASEQQLGQAQDAARRALSPGGAQEPAGIGATMQQGITKGAEQFKRQTGPLFDQLEREAGDEALVPTAPLREAIDAIVGRKSRTAAGVSGATSRTDAGLKVGAELQTLLDTAGRAEKIPFWMARELQSQLGELQRLSGGQAIGNLRQGEYGQLYAGVSRGLDEFLQNEGSDLAPRLAALKQDYRTGKQLFNDSLGQLTKDSKAPEDVFKEVFGPGHITKILDFRQAVSDDVWQQAVDSWKGSLLKAGEDANGVLMPSKVAKEIQKYDKTGALDLILGPEAESVRRMADTLKLMGRAERVAGGANTSGTAAAANTSGLMMGLGYLTNPYAAAGGVVAPNLLSRYVTSPTGVDQLSRAATPVVPNLGQLLGPEGLRPLAQWLGAQ